MNINLRTQMKNEDRFFFLDMRISFQNLKKRRTEKRRKENLRFPRPPTHPPEDNLVPQSPSADPPVAGRSKTSVTGRRRSLQHQPSGENLTSQPRLPLAPSPPLQIGLLERGTSSCFLAFDHGETTSFRAFFFFF